MAQKEIMYQILVGLTYCHSNRIFHRDLKPNNVLVSSKGVIKLADFGLARTYSIPLKTYTHEIMTLWYRAPEVLLGAKHYSLPVDMWSVGCIFYEIAHNRELLSGDSEIDQIFKILRLLGSPSEETWPGVTTYEFWQENFPKFKPQNLEEQCPKFDADALDLMSKMVALTRSERISAKDALRHPYFDDLDKTRFESGEDMSDS